MLLLLHAPRSNTGHELPVYAMRFVANKRQRNGASIFHLPVPTLWCYFLVPVALSVVTDFASRQHYVILTDSRFPPSTARHHTPRCPLIVRTPPPPPRSSVSKGMRCQGQMTTEANEEYALLPLPRPIPSRPQTKTQYNIGLRARCGRCLGSCVGPASSRGHGVRGPRGWH